MGDILSHLEGERTYGHYLLNSDNECKLFAFDIDLDEQPDLDKFPPNKDLQMPEEDGTFNWGSPRHLWLDRSKISQRNFLKYQMRAMAHELAKTIHSEFDLQTAVTYTGAKGMHVYGFTGLLPAKAVREGAELVLKVLDKYNPHLGSNFFKYKPEHGGDGYNPDQINHELSNQCFTVELFPKQTEIKEGGYGNLMRLPLGVNLKNPKDRTFFVDQRAPLTSFLARDAVEALTTTDQWQ